MRVVVRYVLMALVLLAVPVLTGLYVLAAFQLTLTLYTLLIMLVLFGALFAVAAGFNPLGTDKGTRVAPALARPTRGVRGSVGAGLAAGATPAGTRIPRRAITPPEGVLLGPALPPRGVKPRAEGTGSSSAEATPRKVPHVPERHRFTLAV